MSDDVIVDNILPIFGGSVGFADFLPISFKKRFAPRSAACRLIPKYKIYKEGTELVFLRFK